jgi:glucose/arabinose dehydrogenase
LYVIIEEVKKQMKLSAMFMLILALGLTSCAPTTSTPSTGSDTGPPKATGTPYKEPITTQISQPEQTPIEETTIAPITSLPTASDAQWTLVTDGLSAPLGLENAGDDRLFILERGGLIWIFSEGHLSTDPFLDVSDKVSTQGSEQGLLGLAFHPDYGRNGTFFVNYTNRDGDTVVSSFQVSSSPNRADPQSEMVLLTIAQPYRNHNGGDLAFGPDGFLYIATGDGGSGGDPQGNAQNLTTLLGKILRIDVDEGNPYATPVDNIKNGLPEIWAYGLRNPWRIHFDYLTGDLYIADVGQNQWEEVNFQPSEAQAGWNFGWDIREGTHPFEPGDAVNLIDPVAEYSHQFGISVTGGVVVRDPRLPDWQGVYLYGDFGSGIIWGLLQLPDGGWENAQLWDTEAGISSFGQDSIGRVYLVDYNGRILRLDPAQ